MSKKNKKQRRKKTSNTDGYLIDYDDTFAFIAGYTSGGAAYGITWEEMEAFEHVEEFDLQDEESMELPFDVEKME